MRRAFFLTLLFCFASCVGGPESCDLTFDECDYDRDCEPGFICASDLLGFSCVQAQACETSADCPPREVCVDREPSVPEHPFAAERPSNRVCKCVTGDCSVDPTGAGGGSSSGGGGGAGGAGGDGSGGGGGSGGAGGGNQGGAGGAP